MRRLPFAIRQSVSKELARLEKDGAIEPINSSEWISPLVVAWKKSGKIRLCVDLREVNKAIIPDKFPLPTVDELLSELRGAKHFAKLDLATAYHQLPLHEDSRDLTAFITHEGLFRFRRVCFGLSSAPSAFQKMMSVILCGLKGVQCYLDDVVVYGKTLQEYKQNLRAVLEKSRKVGLKLNEKCQFDLDSIEFLGHLITTDGVKPLPSQARAILDAPAPHDKATLRAFLGLVGYYSKFCKDYATVVEPMRVLIRGEQAFVWTDSAQKSFEKVKSLIAHNITLTLFDPECQTIVTTDASGYGISGVLSQIKDGIEYTVSCASRTLTNHERRYSVGEREALACVWSCERWFTYLWGRHFELRTDHSALTTLLSSKGTGRQTMRIARWNSRLLIFDYTVTHRSGSSGELKVADCLSRLPLPETADCDTDNEVVMLLDAQITDTCVTLHELQKETSEDKTLQKVINFIYNGWPRKSRVDQNMIPFYNIRDELSVIEKVLMRGERIVPPSSITQKLVELAHQGHQGITRTKQRLRELYWWRSMDTHVEESIKTCSVCQRSDKSARTYIAPLSPIDFPKEPWHTLAMDIVGPLETLPQDCRFAVTLIDLYSKWPEVMFCSKVTSETVINFLKTIFSKEGLPEEIITDNGSQFVSGNTEKFLKDNNIKHNHSSVYYPEANGQIERFHRVFKANLQTIKLEGKPVKSSVTNFLGLYRATTHATTGKSPSELLHNRKMRTLLNIKGIHSCSTKVSSDSVRKQKKEAR